MKNKNVFREKIRRAAVPAVLCVLLTVSALLLCACREDGGGRKATALVMLSYDENLTVKSENPVRVELGSDAVFEVEIAEGKTFDELNGCEYEDGRLIVRDVRVPVTATATTRDRLLFKYFINPGMKSSVSEGQVPEGTEITLTAPDRITDENGSERVFIGFSNNKTLQRGGTIMSYSPNYTFSIDGNYVVYPNYASPDASIIIYRANGGAASGGGDVLCIESTDTAHTCPNSLVNDGYFSRKGYALAGYNTEADGSGRFYGCGWNVVMPESGVEELYCVWMEETPESDFDYTVSGNFLTINEYKGNADTVVIPETIGGHKVTTIGPKAFRNKDFSAIYITKNMLTVNKQAIVDCPNFTTLYVADTINKIDDNFCTGCDGFRTLIVEACSAPRYQSSRNGNYQNKYERLITAESPKLVVVSGSNSAYGVDSPLLEELLGGRYSVVNYGNHQNAPVSLYIEIAAAWAGKGDIIVHNPESFSQWQHGFNEFSTTVWQYSEGCYGCLSVVDIRHYSKVFSTFSDYCSSRKSRNAETYETVAAETVNKWGDYSLFKSGKAYTPGYNSHGYNGPQTFRYADNLNAAYQLARDAGMKVYMSFGVINELTLTASSRKPETQEAYVKLREETFTPDAFISDISTYIMADKYFFNADYHVTTEGAKVRTENLAKDILAQLEKEGVK